MILRRFLALLSAAVIGASFVAVGNVVLHQNIKVAKAACLQLNTLLASRTDSFHVYDNDGVKNTIYVEQYMYTDGCGDYKAEGYISEASLDGTESSDDNGTLYSYIRFANYDDGQGGCTGVDGSYNETYVNAATTGSATVWTTWRAVSNNCILKGFGSDNSGNTELYYEQDSTGWQAGADAITCTGNNVFPNPAWYCL